MATAMASVDNREVVRCDKCLLVQFRTVSNNCRRCHQGLDEEDIKTEPAIVPARTSPPPKIEHGQDDLRTGFSLAIKYLRGRLGLSQRGLAGRMGVPRTYVSKLENGKTLPTLASLSKIALSLEVSECSLVEEATGVKAIPFELDPFIVQVTSFFPKLDQHLIQVISKFLERRGRKKTLQQ